jgi:hypothetical protein
MGRTLGIAVVIGAAAPALAQHEWCGTQLDPAHTPLVLERQAAGFYDPVGHTDEPAYVPLTFHVVRSSAGIGGMTQHQLDLCVEYANMHFTEAEIQFCQAGETLYIDSDFWFTWQPGAHVDILRQINPVPETINIYFAPRIDNFGALCGISSFTFSAVQGIGMANGCTPDFGDPSTFSHELGHWFDLFHTHETAVGVECVERTNCRVSGDLLCDTPADPGLSGRVNPNGCTYEPPMPVSPPCPNDPDYDPQVENIMSYAPQFCTTIFTEGQNERALATLANGRHELDLGLCALQNICYADCDGNETLDVFDFLCFQDLFATNNPEADCDGNEQLDIFDFLCFQDLFAKGCP